MKTCNRDLLVLVKHAQDNQESMEKELTQLHRLLMDVENSRTFCKVFEVVDCNRFRVFTDEKRILKTISYGEGAFVFLNNKN